MTARRITYADGLLSVTADWFVGTFKFMLVASGWTPDETIGIYVDDITGFEFSDTSYTRQTMVNPTVDVDLPADVGDPGFIRYGCDDPDFGVMSDSGVASSLVLYEEVTNDADSPIVAVYPVGYTADGGSGLFAVNPLGAVVISTACSAGSTTGGS